MSEMTISSSEGEDRGLLSGQYWGELRIFAEVARAKSFNKAAERLGLSQPTIGRKVRRLQDLIGAQLFFATKSGVRLTQRGEELASALTSLDQSLFSIANDLRARDKDAEGTVRISISDGLAAFFAAPALPDFTARHPRIQMHLCSIGGFSDPRETQTDMMLTPTPITRGDLLCAKVGILHFLPFASRHYLERHGMPSRETNADHLFLQSQVYESDVPIWLDWRALCAGGRIAHRCDNPFAYGMMVRSGLGIGLLGSYTMHEEHLVHLDLGIHVPVRLYVIALNDRLKSPPVRIAFDWLCATFGESNRWFHSQLDFPTLPISMPAIDTMFGS